MTTKTTRKMTTLAASLGGAILAGMLTFSIYAVAQTGGDVLPSSGPRFFTVPASCPAGTASKAVMCGKTVSGKTEIAAKTADGEVVLTTGGAIAETDPLALKAAGTDNVKDTHIDWGSGASQVNADDVPASATKAIPTTSDVADGVEAHGWGNHASAGYLTVESDPAFSGWNKSDGINITESQISDFGTYLTAESDPAFTGWNKSDGISITESQISDLGTYLTAESDPDFTGWNKSDGISITESQISDLGAYLTAETDPAFTGWNKSDGISITESQISDLQSYLTAETDPAFSGWNKSDGISITESQISDLGTYLTAESDPVFSALYSGGVLTLGAGGTDGGLKLYSEQGETDRFVQFNPHVAMTMDVTYTLPADDGTASQYLQTDGAGALSWQTLATGIAWDKVCVVAKSGGDYTTVAAALTAVAGGSCGSRSVGTLSASNRWTLVIAPGVYTENLTFVNWIDVVGVNKTASIAGYHTLPGTGGSVRISNLTFTDTSANDTFSSTTSGNVEVDNCDITRTEGSGHNIFKVGHTSCSDTLMVRNNKMAASTSDSIFTNGGNAERCGVFYFLNNHVTSTYNFLSSIYTKTATSYYYIYGNNVDYIGQNFIGGTLSYSTTYLSIGNNVVRDINGGVAISLGTSGVVAVIHATLGNNSFDGSTYFSTANGGTTTYIAAPNLLSQSLVQAGMSGYDGQWKLYSEQGATDYTYTINPHVAATQDVTLTLPPDDGTANQALKTDGAGALSWGTVADGTAEFNMGAHSIVFTQQTITSSSNVATIDWRNSPKAKIDLSENVTTMNFTAPSAASSMTLEIIQGAGPFAITWPGTVKWPGGTPPTLTATDDAIDIISFYYDGTSYLGTYSQAFATP